MVLTQRDVDIITSIQRWRALLSRQIKVLCGFSGQRACDRRLKKLIEAGYIERRHYIYGVPRLYFVTKKAVKLLDLEYYTQDIRIEQIIHDISVIDTAIYLINNTDVDVASITTERDLKHKAGFGNPKHFPDFVYTKDNETFCVEVELSAKKTSTLERNMKNNYTGFDFQQWFVPSDRQKVVENVQAIGRRYGVKITPLERVIEYVRNL